MKPCKNPLLPCLWSICVDYLGEEHDNSRVALSILCKRQHKLSSSCAKCLFVQYFIHETLGWVPSPDLRKMDTGVRIRVLEQAVLTRSESCYGRLVNLFSSKSKTRNQLSVCYLPVYLSKNPRAWRRAAHGILGDFVPERTT